MASDSRRLKAELKLILCQVTALVRDNTNTDIDTKRVTSIFISVSVLQCMKLEGLSLGLVYQMVLKYFYNSCLMVHILHLQIFYVLSILGILCFTIHIYEIFYVSKHRVSALILLVKCVTIFYTSPVFFYWGHFL